MQGGQAELTSVADSALRWFTYPKTVTHPGTNRVQRRVTMLIETNTLPLSQIATSRHQTRISNEAFTLCSIKKMTVKFLQHLLQILTEFDNFCTILTRYEFCTSECQNVSLHNARVRMLQCNIRKHCFHTSAQIFLVTALNTQINIHEKFIRLDYV